MRKERSALRGCAAVLTMLAGSAAIASQGQPPGQVPASQNQATSASLKSGAEEVLLDVVVRDKKGRPVNDLKPGDFQILDNGEPQKISSFRLVQGSEAIAAGGGRSQLDPLRQVRLVTMIFHCFGNDSRQLARHAAVDLLEGELSQNVYIAVMTIDYKIEVLQPFTNNLELLKTAIN